MGTPLPHTSTADAVFVWGYQDSALRAVCPCRGATPYESHTNAPIGAGDRVGGRKEVAPYEDRSAVDVRGRMTRFCNLRPLWGSYKYGNVSLRPRGVDLSEVLTPGYFRAMPTASLAPTGRRHHTNPIRTPYESHTDPIRIPYESHTNPIRDVGKYPNPAPNGALSYSRAICAGHTLLLLLLLLRFLALMRGFCRKILDIKCAIFDN